jgi:hypothetical protein
MLTISKIKDDSGRYEGITWSEIFFEEYVLHLIIVLPFLPLIAILTKYLISKKQKLFVIFLIHFLISIVFKPVIGFIPIYIEYYFENNGIDALFWDKYFNMFFLYIEYNIFIYITLVAITYSYYYFDKAKLFKIKQSQLSAELATNKLKALKSNLQPHFLFNTLNSIHVLIDEDKEKSKDVLVDLSNILREILDKNTEDKIEIQDEVSILKKYISIIKTRYKDQLNIKMHIDDGLEHVLIPTLTIQQLVENSVKHGIDKDHKFLNIDVYVTKIKDKLEVKVTNNGKFLDKSFAEILNNGSGLNGIKERFKVLYDNNFHFDVYNDNQTVVNHFIIPLEDSISEVLAS